MSRSNKKEKSAEFLKKYPSLLLALVAFALGCFAGMQVNSSNLIYEGQTSEYAVAIPSNERSARGSASQMKLPRKSVTIERPGYTLEYDGRTKNANWVYECLTSDCLKGKVERENFAFVEDPKIPKAFQNTLEDFKGSGFDRGHLAPAADHKRSSEEMRDTFYMSNMSPQVPQFNRGYWVKLEKYVRDLTKSSKAVHVTTGPLFLPNLEEHGKKYVKYQVIGKNNVAVPTHFFKVIVRETGVGKTKAEAYILPNQQIAKETPLSQFQATLQDVEKVSGLSF